MTPELIGKYVESKDILDRPVNIFFRQRNSITGLFIKGNDYEEMKAKNFWRIVSESKIEEWHKTHNTDLAKLFSGSDFTRLK
ncbi:MAG TPA: short-chain dehydrogenase [Ferruginibacter sp.]|nr:short-chain dehydrogenase [Ferruginibacter sp.]HMP21463.1 short-chain dehydrogenase [Ferruginibacter sp.]